MNKNEAFLALYFDAPLQSWGYQSRFDRRTTLSYPTRSGVLGMICAASGVGRENYAFLLDLNALKMLVYDFGHEGRLVDYHTVGGGYDPKTERQYIVKNAEGKWGKNTVVTRREYLQGAKFGVVISGEQTLLERIAAAMADPHWGIWFGRKCCIPAAPVCHGVYPSQSEALMELERLSGKKYLRCVVEVEEFEEGTDSLRDVPVQFSARNFSTRRIAVTPSEMIGG